jgi:hypothetical protein
MIIKSIWILVEVSYESGNKKLFSATSFNTLIFSIPFFHKKLYSAISSSEEVVELSDNIFMNSSELVSSPNTKYVRLEPE